MKKIYLEAKCDLATSRNYGIVAGELITFRKFNSLNLRDSDLRFFDAVELDERDTYTMFGVRKPARCAQKRYLTADEMEKYR